MKSITSVAAVIAGAFALGACEPATSPVAPPTSATLVKQVNPKPFYSFTKSPVAYAEHNIAPSADVTAFLFSLETDGTKSVVVTQMAFQFFGTVHTGDITNFRIVYFADGLNKPGVVVGTNDGSTWLGPGGTAANFVTIVFSIPVVLSQNFKGFFALQLDVNATQPFFFQPQMQTMTISIGGVEQGLPWSTCDLPLAGDTFRVS
jgi:hypothetical protein